nr:class D sortase [uncultured Oscillibacter sp.]
MRKLLSTLMATMAMLSVSTVGASAADYSFSTDAPADYYGSTSYEEVYGSQYNYGGPNVVDYQIPELEYGNSSTTQIGVMEKIPLPGLQQSVYSSAGGGSYGITDSAGAGVPGGTPGISGTAGGVILPGSVQFTTLSDISLLSNGAIGRISIPALGIKNYYVWEDTTSSSMSKGVGHFTSTSVWNGNVGIAGHNRGAKYIIGSIKNLETGDKITYTTSQGTRTYAVETVSKIRNDDWSYLETTSDNRITLVTCVAGDSSHRWCVQAVEVH